MFGLGQARNLILHTLLILTLEEDAELNPELNEQLGKEGV